MLLSTTTWMFVFIVLVVEGVVVFCLTKKHMLLHKDKFIKRFRPYIKKALSKGFSKKFLRSLREQFRLFDKPMEEICKKTAKLKAKNIMYIPTEGEYVNENDSLDVAIHRLVMGHHQALLVTKDDNIKNIVGILRKTDVFMEVCEAIKSCYL